MWISGLFGIVTKVSGTADKILILYKRSKTLGSFTGDRVGRITPARTFFALFHQLFYIIFLGKISLSSDYLKLQIAGNSLDSVHLMFNPLDAKLISAKLL